MDVGYAELSVCRANGNTGGKLGSHLKGHGAAVIGLEAPESLQTRAILTP